MKGRKTNKKNRAGNGSAATRLSDKAFSIVIVILVVILVILLIAFGTKLKNNHYSYYSTPDELMYSIRNGNYINGVQEMRHNISQGKTVEKDEEYAVPYALLDYYIAESYYVGYSKAAEGASDASEKTRLSDAAASYLEKMEAAGGKMGDLSFMTEEIDGVFTVN